MKYEIIFHKDFAKINKMLVGLIYKLQKKATNMKMSKKLAKPSLFLFLI